MVQLCCRSVIEIGGVGPYHLHRNKLPVEGLLLVLYYADVGSESAEKLALLASFNESSTLAIAQRVDHALQDPERV